MVEVYEVIPHPDPEYDSAITRRWEDALELAKESFRYHMENCTDPASDFSVRIRETTMHADDLPDGV